MPPAPARVFVVNLIPARFAPRVALVSDTPIVKRDGLLIWLSGGKSHRCFMPPNSDYSSYSTAAYCYPVSYSPRGE